MGLSVITPIGQSLERTKKILFDPFDIKKWFILGFCAWLAKLGEGYGGGGSGSGGRDRGQSFGSALSQAREWAMAHLLLPLHVFWRCYSLYFIEPIGPELRLFPAPRIAEDLTPDYPM